MWEQLKDGWLEILNIQKFRRMVGYTAFYCFSALISYAYANNTKRAGFSNADQFYASYPAGTELLTDTEKLYKAALEIVSILRSGDQLNGAFWLNTLNAKEITICISCTIYGTPGLPRATGWKWAAHIEQVGFQLFELMGHAQQ